MMYKRFNRCYTESQYKIKWCCMKITFIYFALYCVVCHPLFIIIKNCIDKQFLEAFHI